MSEEKARLEACQKRIKSLVAVETNGSRIEITNNVIAGIDSTLDHMNV
jgi:hypothetical protein